MLRHTSVLISEPKLCDFCLEKGEEVEAQYDGKTVYGAWANMCKEHFQRYGLGLGRGQRLIKVAWLTAICPICGGVYSYKESYKPTTCGQYDCVYQARVQGLDRR